MKILKHLIIFSFLILFLNGCNGKLPGADARKYPPDPKLRVKKNIEEGRGFRLMDSFESSKGTTFEFASSNELWRASLDIIDFMPLTSANYSGGVIITDWYSDNNPQEHIKLTIRFLSNEVRSDAVDIKIFYKKCTSENNCKITERSDGKLSKELKKEILKLAAVYSKQKKDKEFRPYRGFEFGERD